MAQSPPTDPTKTSIFSVSQLKTGEDLSRRYKELKQARTMLEIQWRLNLAYYQGRQYTYYNTNARRIEELPTADGEKPRYRVRMKSNQMMPGAQGIVAKMTKTKPVMNATPGSSDAQDVRAAQMSERLLEYWWTGLNMDEKLYETLLWAVNCSQGYMLPCWDDHAGKPMTFTIGSDGQPITDESLKTLYFEELARLGIPRELAQRTFYMGDVRVEVLSPFSVYLDPNAKTIEDCKYAMVVNYLDPDEVKARYGKWLTPDSIPTSEEQVTSISVRNGYDSQMKTSCKLITGYFVPSAILPKGRIVTWSDSSQEILDDQPWQYPYHELPLVKFGMLKIPGSLYDSSMAEHAIPIQQELNRTLSQIIEYKNLTIKPRVWAPYGSLRQRLTNEPGAVFQYQPVGGLKPEIEQLPSMPPYVFEHLKDIGSRLQDAFYMSQVDGGSLPPNVEAFTAIDLLQEMSSDNIAPIVKLMERSLEKVGSQLLALAQKYYVEPRLIAIKGANGSAQVKEFTQADIAGGVTVSVETGSGMPRTRAGRMAQIQELVDKGYISMNEGLKRMDIADLKGPLAAIAADEDQALREHDKLIEQIPINADALQKAIQVVQTPDPEVGVPVNPDTGKPFTSPEEMMQYVHEQGLQPTAWENFAIHVDQHSLFMKSVEYEALPMNVQADFIVHFEATYDRLINLPVQGVKGPNVNLQIKSTAGPTATAKVLERAGVYQVTPDDLMEPELPSWISDDLTKDPGMAENSPEAIARAQAAAEQAAATAQAADTQHVQALQNMTHAEEKHQQSMAHADQAHQAKLKAASQAKERNTGKT